MSRKADGEGQHRTAPEIFEDITIVRWISDFRNQLTQENATVDDEVA
jgi:hypothetical protein